ncbi:hypothetical protein RHGRI_013620 [Rhododendron griersonianum]|uniref:Ribosomal protein L33 n=1 Tax=Rhododendron griersonianum TaxID=479676 RepID=A0AAV6K693_9ERIC|nr:hypothetical protein RHGRI_013620 [Rhododendron griersonianum]
MSTSKASKELEASLRGLWSSCSSMLGFSPGQTRNSDPSPPINLRYFVIYLQKFNPTRRKTHSFKNKVNRMIPSRFTLRFTDSKTR